MPAGETGELYIGGIGVGRGYLDNVAQTAALFVPDPFSPVPGARVYRTGDLVRQLPDGSLQFLSRIDDQLHIRGHRVEPREIEAVLRQYPHIDDAVIVPYVARSGARQLAAYIGTRSGAAKADLTEHLLSRLPEWMVPASFVVLSELPKNIAGKIDRQRLPAPDRAARSAVAATTPAEQRVLDVWRSVLGETKSGEQVLGIHDDFFTAGGDSLLGARIMNQLARDFELDLPWHVLYRHRTVADLVTGLGLDEPSGQQARREPVESSSDSDLPSFSQESLWFLDELAPGLLAYNIDYSFRVTGQLDARALERALRAVAERHAVLLWRIARTDGEPRVIRSDPSAITVVERDLRASADSHSADPVASARQLAAREAATPFDLAAGPLLRALLLRIGDQDYVLQLTVHHIVFDGLSTDIFKRELGLAYAAELEGRKPAWPALSTSFAQAAAWQRERLGPELLAAQTAFWRDTLADAPPLLELPADRRRPAVPSYQGASYRFEVPGDLARRMRSLAQQHGVTLFTVMLSAYQVLLARHASTQDVVVGMPAAGRSAPQADELIGFFVNSLPVRASVADDITFSELVDQARVAMTDALDHQDLPFTRLVAELAPERDLSRNPIFQVWFDLFRPRSKLVLPGAGVEDFDIDFVTSSFDLRLDLTDDGVGPLPAELIYATDLFDEGTVASFARRYLAVLRAVAADPATEVWDIDLLTAGEKERVLRTWAAPPPAPTIGTLAAGFEAQARRTPEAIAVADGTVLNGAVPDGTGRISYAQLNQQANQLARYLRGRGIGRAAAGREDVVAVLLPRGIQFATAVLAVIKAGGAYLPLAVDAPVERNALMIGDSGAALVLTETSYLATLPGDVAAIALDAATTELAGLPSGDLPEQAGLDNLLYVMYTSGSTGTPKGVAMPQRPLVSLMNWHLHRYASDSTVLQFSTPTFDMSFQELLFPLLSGGTVVPVSDDDRLDADALLSVMRTAGVDTVLCPPVVLSHIADQAGEPGTELPPITQLVAAGEELRLDPALRALASRLGPVTFDNQYGPTESHCVASYRLTGDPASWPQVVPVGAPQPGTQVLLLDDRLNPVPPGVPGEVCIGRPLARGYLGKPDLTAERFVPNPYADAPGERLYLTGDLARWSTAGLLQFVGRRDDQVKIRGCRVEPSEVETALRRSPEVAATAVLPVTVNASLELAAYVVPADPASPASTAELRKLLKSVLPDYMIPSYFITIPELPLTKVGKINRQALPSPRAGQASDGELVEPRGPYEAVVVSISDRGARPARRQRDGGLLRAWRPFAASHEGDRQAQVGLLGRLAAAAHLRPPRPARPGAGRGGSAGRRYRGDVGRAGRHSDRQTSRDHVSDARAELLRRRLLGSATPQPTVVAEPRPERPVLSFAQERLWFIERLHQGTTAYSIPLNHRIHGALDAGRLEQALTEIIARHESLRTRFGEHNGVPYQLVDPPSVRLDRVDLSTDPQVRAGAVTAADLARSLISADAAGP